MARTPLFGRLQQAASVAAEAATRNVSTDQVLAEQAERRLSRRDLLKLAGATGLAAGLSTLGGRPAGAASPQIVVVGAGLAGLTGQAVHAVGGCAVGTEGKRWADRAVSLGPAEVAERAARLRDALREELSA